MINIVFSKDRALQLDAFLRSYAKHVSPLEAVHVLYTSTSDSHTGAYAEVFRRHEFVVPCEQDNFKMNLLSLLPHGRCVTFFVDDQIFIRPYVVKERAGLSLRLGLNLTHNYASGDTPQPLPPYQPLPPDMIGWRWKDGVLAWRYPLSLDGHVFDTSTIRPLLDSIEFHSPNTLESQLQQFVQQFEHGICYCLSKVVNVPWTRTQMDWSNRFAGMSIEELLSYWENKLQLQIDSLYGVANTSVHQEFPLRLEARP